MHLNSVVNALNCFCEGEYEYHRKLVSFPITLLEPRTITWKEALVLVLLMVLLMAALLVAVRQAYQMVRQAVPLLVPQVASVEDQREPLPLY